MAVFATAALTAAVVWCLFYGMAAPLPLGLICLGLGGVLALLGRHDHTGILSIDAIACRSRLNRVNASLKLWTCLALLLLCVASRNPGVGLGMALLMLLLSVCAGRVSLHDYLSMLSLPAAFLLVSALALLVSVRHAPVGVLNLPVLGFWLCVTASDQAAAILVLSKALGAVSCLYLLSLSTPMTEIIAALRKAKAPAIFTELMYLIYRYIFILLEMHRTMHDAAESRLGYGSFRLSLHTTGSIYANLLARSFRRASQCFDAMESRCYDGELRFLEAKKPVTLPQCLFAGVLVACTLAAAYFL